MTFTTLSPPMKRHSDGQERATASVRVLSNGEVRCMVNMSAALVAKMDRPKRATVQAGVADHRGMIRIEYGATGDFAVVHRTAKDARLYLPEIECLPRRSTNTALCRITAHDNGVLVLRLPLAEWEESVRAREPRKAA